MNVLNTQFNWFQSSLLRQQLLLLSTVHGDQIPCWNWSCIYHSFCDDSSHEICHFPSNN